MATPIRIKRRGSGAPGAPASLQNAELAYNEVDDVLYYGKGTGGAGGTATTIPAIAGKGAFVDLASAQTVSGLKTFSVLPQSTATPTNDDDFTTREWVLAQIGSSGGGGFSLAQVEDAIAAIPDEQQRAVAEIEWEYASQFERMHPLIGQVGGALGLTPEQIDTMWTAAHDT